MKRMTLLALAALGLGATPAVAQSPPGSVFIEALTWMEIRDRIQGGATTVLIPTAGTE
jgi:hypothetical protein